MYVVTGATGHTGSVVVQSLLSKGQQVRAIGRHAEKLNALAAKGVEPVVADLVDLGALTKAFAGAKAVYVVIPPDATSQNYRAEQDQITEAIASALEKAKVKYAVALSSVGADKPEGTGPVVGLHRLEQRLNRISNINVLHLRAGYFMENTLPQIDVIKAAGVLVGPVRPDLKIPMIASRDIGHAAAEALLALNFRSQERRELLGQRDISYNEIASIIGAAINRADLAYLQPPVDEVRDAFIRSGMSENVANLILEMAESLNSGYMRAIETRSSNNTTPTSYETFVKEEFLPKFKEPSIAA